MNPNASIATHLIETLSFAKSRALKAALTVLLGVIALSALAQISIPLPFTPVPITGQTFGVTLIALFYGRKLGVATVASYLAVGAAGLPVFANWASGLTVGPTMGYLFGMLVSSFIVGTLADRGFTRSFLRAYVASLFGSLFIFGFGLAVLSFFVPKEMLLVSGLIPFIPGDLIKSALAALIASRSDHMLRR